MAIVLSVIEITETSTYIKGFSIINFEVLFVIDKGRFKVFRPHSLVWIAFHLQNCPDFATLPNFSFLSITLIYLFGFSLFVRMWRCMHNWPISEPYFNNWPIGESCGCVTAPCFSRQHVIDHKFLHLENLILMKRLQRIKPKMKGNVSKEKSRKWSSMSKSHSNYAHISSTILTYNI